MAILEWAVTGLVPAAYLLAAFVAGAAVGSGLNVLVYRLPRGKSALWPPSSCGACLARIRWHDNVPILGYLFLRGRCRDCGTRFSPRYLLAELAAGLGFAGLLWLEVFANWHDFPALRNRRGVLAGDVPPAVWGFYLAHIYLFSVAVVQFCCRLDGRGLPPVVALPGLLAGPLVAAFAPWPWPNEVVEAGPGAPMLTGLQVWPLFDGLSPGPVCGLLTWLAGVTVPWLLLRVGRWLAGLPGDRVSMGDTLFLATVGGLLGWQAAATAFLAALVPLAIEAALTRRGTRFGVWLAVAAVAALLGIPHTSIGRHFDQVIPLLVLTAAAGAAAVGWARRRTVRPGCTAPSGEFPAPVETPRPL